MLTPADEALWRRFRAEIDARQGEFAGLDMVPVVLVCARICGRHDDAAWIGLEMGDVGVQTLGGVTRYNLAALLRAAAEAVEKGEPR